MIARLAPRSRPRAFCRKGFTLIEIIVAVAIVAVLAGAITPLVFRELVQAREDATERELAALADGLVDFYTDTGRLPTEAEGLAALVTDPGAAGWQGPYVAADRGDPEVEVTIDGFNQAYAYDLAPSTDPAGGAAAVVASAGADGAFDAGAPGRTWQLAGAGDDLVQTVITGPSIAASWPRPRRRCWRWLRRCARTTPTTPPSPRRSPTSRRTYLDRGVDGDALVDPWNQGYLVSAAPAGGAAVELTIRSAGPDRADDGGGDDDIAVVVSNVPLGREISVWKQQAAQDAVNAAGATLVGPWPGHRVALGLPATFDVDGWGRPFLVNTRPTSSTRPVRMRWPARSSTTFLQESAHEQHPRLRAQTQR